MNPLKNRLADVQFMAFRTQGPDIIFGIGGLSKLNHQPFFKRNGQCDIRKAPVTWKRRFTSKGYYAIQFGAQFIERHIRQSRNLIGFR